MYRNQYVDEKIVNDGIKKVIIKMCLGLLLSFIMMFVSYNSERILLILEKDSKLLMSLAFLFPVFFTITINRISMLLVNCLLTIYSLLVGLLLTYTVFKFGSTLIILAVGATAIIFTLMSLFAYYTNEDLERERVLIKISLFFFIITYLVNMYYGVYILYWILSYWALITFTGLMGYDFQNTKKSLSSSSNDTNNFERISLTGTLQFYLNFIILSLVLLNLLGKILK